VQVGVRKIAATIDRNGFLRQRVPWAHSATDGIDRSVALSEAKTSNRSIALRVLHSHPGYSTAGISDR